MAAPLSNTKIRVPKGFPNLIEHLTREVLRFQPTNIYDFARNYFEDLLQLRAETKCDDLAIICAKLEDRYYNNHAFKENELNSEEHHKAALKIQTKYRQHLAKKKVQNVREENAIEVIKKHIGSRKVTPADEPCEEDVEMLKQRFPDGVDAYDKIQITEVTCNNAEVANEDDRRVDVESEVLNINNENNSVTDSENHNVDQKNIAEVEPASLSVDNDNNSVADSENHNVNPQNSAEPEPESLTVNNDNGSVADSENHNTNQQNSPEAEPESLTVNNDNNSETDSENLNFNQQNSVEADTNENNNIDPMLSGDVNETTEENTKEVTETGLDSAETVIKNDLEGTYNLESSAPETAGDCVAVAESTESITEIRDSVENNIDLNEDSKEQEEEKPGEKKEEQEPHSENVENQVQNEEKKAENDDAENVEEMASATDRSKTPPAEE